MSAGAGTTDLPDERRVTTAAAWKKAAQHDVLCPSGVIVGIRIPDLPALVETGDIPQHLLDAALGAASAGESQTPSKDMIVQQREFTDLVVGLTVVEPKLTEADIVSIPYEDKDFIVAIATRQRDLDAEGKHIAGLDKSERFRRFRRLGEFDETVEGL
jgi:hypothetical protein